MSGRRSKFIFTSFVFLFSLCATENNDIPENTKITISNASKYFSSTL